MCELLLELVLLVLLFLLLRCNIHWSQLLHVAYWSVQGKHESRIQQVLTEWVTKGKVETGGGLLLEVGRLAFFFETIEILVVKDIHLLALVEENLGKVFKLECTALSGEDIALEVGVLK